jgi:hypothetical protein
MKKAFTYLFTVIMAALVFYGGAGVNVIMYCCNQCRSAGIETLLKDDCCGMSKYNHTCNHGGNSSHTGKPAGNHPCHNDYGENGHPADHPVNVDHSGYDNDHAGDDCCHIKRIDFDWSSHSFSELEIDLSPVVFNLPPGEIINISNIICLIGEVDMIMLKGPPVYPRDFLSKYTVLLI